MIRTLLCISVVMLSSHAAHADSGLQSARDAFHSGDRAQAVTLLRAALETPQDLAPNDIADAQHLLGVALLDAEQPAQAAVVFSTALQADEASDTTVLEDYLRFHLASAMSTLDRHAEARPLFHAVAKDAHSPFQVQAAFQEALATLAMKKRGPARKLFSKFIATYPGARTNHEARVHLAGLEASRGRAARAIEIYRRVIRESPQSKAASSAQLALDELAQQGHKSAAKPTAAEIRRDVEWLVSERRFDEALPTLLRLRAEAKKARDKERTVSIGGLLVKTYRGLGMLEEALETDRWLKRRGGDGLGPSTTTFLLGLLERHDDAEKRILKSHYRRKSAKYWTTIGDHRMRFGRYAEATVAFRRAAKKHGRWVPKDLSRKLAWSVFNGENPGEAVELFTKIGRRDRSRRTWSQYWTARALQDAGKIEEARDGYESLLARSETDFYGLMADSRLRELKRKADAPDAPDAPPTTLAAPEPALVPQDPSPTPEKLESILAATGALQHEPSDRGTLAWTAAMLQIDPAWQPGLPQEEARRSALVRLDDGWSNVAPEATRAAELHRLGFLEEARNELRVLATDLRIMGSRKWGRLVGRARSDMLDNRRDKKARGGASLRHAGRRSRAQAREFYKATRGGAFRATLQEAREALGDNHAIRWKSIRSGILRRRIAANTEEGYRKAYPIAWPEAMRISTKDHDVPPAFLYGIMTTESSFHPHAVSVAHAYGLVQMIPRTGRRVALELGYGEFMPEVLLDPSPSIYMGGRYMGRLLDRFYDQEPLAAAAYNAGPHRVADWLKANPDRPLDVFVEEIPYGQARRYTKKVLSHTARYRRLYYGEDRMYVTNHLESRHRTSPNY